jgi:hypothetical protein
MSSDLSLTQRAEAVERLADELHRLIGLLDRLTHSPEGLQWLEGELQQIATELKRLGAPPETLPDEELQMVAAMRRNLQALQQLPKI